MGRQVEVRAASVTQAAAQEGVGVVHGVLLDRGDALHRTQGRRSVGEDRTVAHGTATAQHLGIGRSSPYRTLAAYGEAATATPGSANN